MNSKKWNFNPHGFFAVYHTVEKAKPLSMQECADEMTKQFKMYFEKSKVSRIVAATKAAIGENPTLRAEYEKYKAEFGAPKGFLFKKELQKDGSAKWVSPYEEGQHYLLEKASNKSLNSDCAGLNRIYEALGRVRPKNWTYSQVKTYLDGLQKQHEDMAFRDVVLIRNLQPRFKHGEQAISTRPYKRSAAERVKSYDLFSNEVEAVNKHIGNEGYWYVEGLHRLHLILGCREGSVRHDSDERRNVGGRGGILGLQWSNINQKRNTIDVFEGKTKGGIMWKGCPLDNFGWDIWPFFNRIKAMKEPLSFSLPQTDGSTYPVTVYPAKDDRIITIAYHALIKIYDYIELVYEKLFKATNKFDTITPHTARHLHCNLLFERGVSSTVICGDANKGVGFVGVGWTDKTTMETYYLSLVERTVQKWVSAAKQPNGTFESFAEVAASQ